MKHLYSRWNVFHRKNSVIISLVSLLRIVIANTDWNSSHKISDICDGKRSKSVHLVLFRECSIIRSATYNEVSVESLEGVVLHLDVLLAESAH